MQTTGSGTRVDKSENNFHALRLVFATLVALYHVVMLSDAPAWRWLAFDAGRGAEVGIQGFFILSGYLVSASFDRSDKLGLYVEKRVRRLYPAYAVVILGCAVLALIFVDATRADLKTWLKYIGVNLVFLNFLQPDLPGVFADNPFTAINGALWTLKVEVMFYILLPLLMVVLMHTGRLRWLVIAAIYIGAEAWRIGFDPRHAAPGQAVVGDLSQQLPGQMSFFIVGVAFYLWREQMAWRALTWALVLAAAIAALALSLAVTPLCEPLRAISLGLVVIWAAKAAPPIFAMKGDISYGLYILHFPIIQTVVSLGLFAQSPWMGAGIALGVSVIGAVLMWLLVERPALRRDSAYRAS